MKMKKMKIKAWLLAITVGIAGLSLYSAAQAATITLTAQLDQRGAFMEPSFFGGGKVTANSYQVRTVGNVGLGGNFQLTRNYHLFNVPQGVEILSASLRIPHPCTLGAAGCPGPNSSTQSAGNGSYDSPDGSETVTFWDITSPAALQTAASISVADFADLGSGTSYGSFVATSTSDGTIESLSLNAAAVADLNLATGSVFGIGGALTSGTATSGSVVERVFRGSDSVDTPTGCTVGLDCTSFQPASELVLVTTPVPAAAWLFGSGVVGLVGIGRRRRGKAGRVG